MTRFFFEHHAMTDKSFFRVHTRLGESFPTHLHIAYELIYVRGGSVLLQVEQKQYRAEEGEMAFIFNSQLHGFRCGEDTGLTVVLFAPELAGDFDDAYRDFVPVSNVFRPPEPPRFTGLLTPYAQKSLIYSACDMLLSSTEMEPAGSRPHVGFLRRMLAYIDRSYGEDCSLRGLANELQYDYAYISRLFQRHTGMRFTEYLNNYRISKACSMLDGGGYTVSEIAERCGYGTQRSFHRNFRGLLQTSPREYVAGRAGGAAEQQRDAAPRRALS